MASKYGTAVTGPAWKGWPLRLGRFAESGKLEGLVADHDALLLWSGGKSDVTLHVRKGSRAERVRFVRHAGMIDLLPKGTLLEEVQWEGQASDCLSVQFGAGTVKSAFGQETALDPDGMRTAMTDPHVVDLTWRLQEQAASGQPWGPMYVEGLSLTLASYVYGRYSGAAQPREEASALSGAEVQRVVEFVEDHLGESLTLRHLSKLVGYSPDHFARLFKRALNKSPYQYVLERRVERAKSLLQNKSFSIAEIAFACGFASQSHLHTAFKARTGVTPGRYRRP